MKKIIPILLIFMCIFSNAQKNFVLKDAQNGKEFVKRDSLSAVKFLDSLAQNNYYFTKIISVKKENFTTEILFDKGKNYNEAQVKIPDSLSKILKTQPEFFTKNLDSLKRNINKKFTDQGYSFSRVQTKFKGFKNEIPTVEISVKPLQQRKINGFVLKGYDKVPKRFVKNLEKEYRGKIYDEKNLISINQQLQNHPFLALERPPQTLFTKDSTQIFLFTQKKKANSFDGVIGFGNDKSRKFMFNGTLDVNFRNIFNGFESLSLYWQRNADKGQTFDLKVDVPYVMGSNVGAHLQANIFRQDSTYATVRFQPSIYLHINHKQKLGIQGILESSTVSDTLYVDGKDFSKKGFGAWYEFTEPSDIALFLYKTKIRAEGNLLSIHYDKENNSSGQNSFYLFGEHNVHLSGNHFLNLKAEAATLQSKKELLSNELLRFGGWNSLRGFGENSLLADTYYFGNAEYRYLIGGQAFFDVFGGFAQLTNKTLSQKPKMYSFGLGFNFILPIGLMSFQISNGSQGGNAIKFNDTKIHWGILSRF